VFCSTDWSAPAWDLVFLPYTRPIIFTNVQEISDYKIRKHTN